MSDQDKRVIYPNINESFSYDIVAEDSETNDTQRVVVNAQPTPLSMPQVPPHLLQPHARVNVPYHEDKARCCSKFIHILGWLLVINGAITAVCNVFFMFMIDSFT